MIVDVDGLVVKDIEDVSPDATLREVAGVYITENRIDLLVGELVQQPNAENAVRLGTYSHGSERAQSTPKTQNRDGISIHRENRAPSEMIEDAIDWIAQNAPNVESICVGCFGPYVSLENRTDWAATEFKPETDANPDYGRLGEVPRYDGWGNMPLHYIFSELFADKYNLFPVIRFFTDVDVAAYGEYWLLVHGDAFDARKYRQESLAFIKISRSVSVGVVHRGRIWQGRLHPGAGALQPMRYTRPLKNRIFQDEFQGICPYHGDCLEGLIGQNALEARMENTPFKVIAEENYPPLWDMVAHYVANLCVATTSFISPSRIVLGGRIVRDEFSSQLSNEFLENVRGKFYQYVKAKDPRLSENALSPDYPEIRDRDNFITLASRRKKKDLTERYAMPGRHGAIRFAASKLMEKKENQNDAA